MSPWRRRGKGGNSPSPVYIGPYDTIVEIAVGMVVDLIIMGIYWKGNCENYL